MQNLLKIALLSSLLVAGCGREECDQRFAGDDDVAEFAATDSQCVAATPGGIAPLLTVKTKVENLLGRDFGLTILARVPFVDEKTLKPGVHDETLIQATKVPAGGKTATATIGTAWQDAKHTLTTLTVAAEELPVGAKKVKKKKPAVHKTFLQDGCTITMTVVVSKP